MLREGQTGSLEVLLIGGENIVTGLVGVEGRWQEVKLCVFRGKEGLGGQWSLPSVPRRIGSPHR